MRSSFMPQPLPDAARWRWRMTGIDPEGFDIVSAVRRGASCSPSAVATPAEARKELVRLAAEARARGGNRPLLAFQPLALKGPRDQC